MCYLLSPQRSPAWRHVVATPISGGGHVWVRNRSAFVLKTTFHYLG